MKNIFTITICLISSFSLLGQISYDGCTNLITTGPSPYTLNQTGTTNDGGTIRNTYVSTSVSCSAGTCSFSIMWNTTNQRWELILNGANLLHYNTSTSAPNPPDLTLGTWVNSSGCGGINIWSGDVQPTVVLPVELTSFESRITKGITSLHWQTASEMNNEKFEIEESQNDREFQKIGETLGHGTTVEAQDYAFEIKNRENENLYYRLKQIDFDGRFEYSKTITVNFKIENREVGEFYPNPSKSGVVNLGYQSNKDERITVAVFDMTSKLVLQRIRQISSGNNNLNFDFSGLNTGIYIIKIGDDKNPIYRKLIID